MLLTPPYTQARRRFRDKQLMADIFGTLRMSDSVLVCVDTVARVLELGHNMLDQMRSTEDLLNNVAFNAGGGFQKGVDVTKRKIRDILPNEGLTIDVIENVLENIDVEDPFAFARSQLENLTEFPAQSTTPVLWNKPWMTKVTLTLRWKL